MLLQGKNAIVTGAAGGIGRAIVAALAREGACVWAFDMAESEEFKGFCRDTESACGVWIRPVYCDLTDEEAVKAAIKRVMADKAPLDILINNAGNMGPPSVFQMVKLDYMRRTLDINFFGMVALTQQAARLMARQKRGAIVNVASIAGLDGDSRLDYSAAKAAVIAASKKMARELIRSGIRVNCLCPGLTDTKLVSWMDESSEKEALSRTLMQRRAKPEEIASVALFLASDMSSCMTGQVIRADCGIL